MNGAKNAQTCILPAKTASKLDYHRPHSREPAGGTSLASSNTAGRWKMCAQVASGQVRTSVRGSLTQPGRKQQNTLTVVEDKFWEP